MPSIWFTADFHFGHNNIIRYCNRPFRSVEEMDQTIIERLNAPVKANDILLFSSGISVSEARRGSWSTVGRFAARRSLRCPEISVNGQPIVLCHYAMRVSNRSHHGAWHLYRHSHGNLPEGPTSLSMDVGIPMTFARGISTKSAGC